MIESLEPLPRSFFARGVVSVARACIGKYLVHATGEGLAVGRIVETEAYRGPGDRAAHSYGGRRTARTEAMFGPAGHAYLFFVYGMHWQFNVVAGQVGQPHAVLVRAVEPTVGSELMAKRRGMATARREISNGPGKLCQALAIDGRAYGVDLTQGPLTVCRGPRVRCRIGRSPRIGIDYAGDWAERPWRFFDEHSRHVSRPAPSRATRRASTPDASGPVRED